jgi:peptidoglycan hydrolase CwlO-like protein
MKEYYTRKEVRTILACSDRTITRKINSGELIVEKKGRKHYFPKDQFNEIKENETDATKQLIQTLQDQIQEKDRQLRERDKQIEKMQNDTTITALEQQLVEKDKQLDNLQRALYTQQGLTKDITDKILQLPQPKKKGFIKRIFESDDVENT